MLTYEQTEELFKLYLKGKGMETKLKKTPAQIDKLYWDFPDRFQQILIDNGMSYRDVAQAVPLSYGQVQKWCQGITRPDMLSLMKLSNTLGISADELLGLS